MTQTVRVIATVVAAGLLIAGATPSAAATISQAGAVAAAGVGNDYPLWRTRSGALLPPAVIRSELAYQHTVGP